MVPAEFYIWSFKASFSSSWMRNQLELIDPNQSVRIPFSIDFDPSPPQGIGSGEGDPSRRFSYYYKRLKVTSKAYVKKQEFEEFVREASVETLATVLRRLAVLSQTKVYLLWRNPALQD